MNSRRDVAKVESLLGRAGALDLAKTDGLTGFFGARTDEAVKKFQKDRGLKMDGLITPQGPTLKTLVQEQERREPAVPGAVISENPTSDPRRENIRSFARKLLEIEKAGVDPRARLLARQLAQAKTDGGQKPVPPAQKPDPRSKNVGGSDANKSRSPVPEVPLYRKEVFRRQKGVWGDYHKSVGALPGITPAEKTILPQIFAAEGGLRDDPESTASSGILQETLDRAKKSGKVPGIENARRPTDLTITQRAAVAKFYFDDTLHTVGGGKALDTISDKKAAGAFADTLFRHGRRKGTEFIQGAVNDTRKEQGLSPITADGKMGPETLSAYRELATDQEGRKLLFENLGRRRKRGSLKTEHPRIDFFLSPESK